VTTTGARDELAAAAAALVQALTAQQWPVLPPPEPARLAALGPAFGLSAFERSLVLLCAAAELEPPLAAALARGSGGVAWPCWALALRALADGDWAALAPDAGLRRWRLLQAEAGSDWLQVRLRIDERLLHHLVGLDALDHSLVGRVRPRLAPAWLPPARREMARTLAPRLTSAAVAPCVHVLAGADADDALDLAAAACAAAGLRLYTLDAADLPDTPMERQTLALVWSREALLAGRALAVTGLDAEHPRRAAAVALAGETLGAVFLPGDDASVAGLPEVRPALRLACAPLSAAERRAAWCACLPGPLDSKVLDPVAQQFHLGVAAVRRAGHAVLQDQGDGPLAHRLWDAARHAARPRLGGLAQVIEPQARWEDLVLPPREEAALRAIVAFVRQRHRVYDDWGFAEGQNRGLGIAALFAGISGTGKTLAAEVLAGALKLDLYRIDLSAVVSKYIGETEKHLRTVFDAADQGGAVLLFDEADALFGKRSEVRDSHDRYANIEVGYLLQRMEAYRGLAILTTNQRSAMDDAFLRRLRFVIEFPFPSPDDRARIWRRTLPARVPLNGVRFDRLAQLNLAGGHIRNIALSAAALAADSDEPLSMRHFFAATRTEYSKLERPLSAVETQGWL
jgi:hypothetical protein